MTAKVSAATTTFMHSNSTPSKPYESQHTFSKTTNAIHSICCCSRPAPLTTWPLPVLAEAAAAAHCSSQHSTTPQLETLNT
jgi:hypothetical protein